MATLNILCARRALAFIDIGIAERDCARWVYGYPEFQEWLGNDLLRLETGRLRAANPPREQVYSILHRWKSGKKIVYGRQSGLFNARYRPLYERLMAGSRAAAHKASAIFVTPFARAMLSV